MIGIKEIESAYERIEPLITKTELEKSLHLSSEETEVFMKLECHQRIARSYKIRGVLSKLLSLTDKELRQGVTAVSSGNHGAALAYGGSLLGVKKVEIFVPETTPLPKVQKMERFGAKVRMVGKNFDEAHHVAEEKILETGLIEVSPYEDPVALAGQGTVALEILRQNPLIDTLVVPIGGGGLICGIGAYAKAFNPDIRIIGVQTEACPAMVDSMRDNVCHEYYESKESVCGALIGGVGRLPFSMASSCIDEVIIVSEETIKRATFLMMKNERIMCEPSSAICYGAFIDNRGIFEGRKTALVISGGNISWEMTRQIIGVYDKEERHVQG
ncbi:MAG: pyridoxal-phosphate dependent enzyme [Peptostreptococcaceae bacterium]|nr:pyridoxal-phosphate dependent enzyme [Peptostreptococcaceae bacterium]